LLAITQKVTSIVDRIVLTAVLEAKIYNCFCVSVPFTISANFFKHIQDIVLLRLQQKDFSGRTFDKLKEVTPNILANAVGDLGAIGDLGMQKHIQAVVNGELRHDEFHDI